VRARAIAVSKSHDNTIASVTRHGQRVARALAQHRRSFSAAVSATCRPKTVRSAQASAKRVVSTPRRKQAASQFSKQGHHAGRWNSEVTAGGGGRRSSRRYSGHFRAGDAGAWVRAHTCDRDDLNAPNHDDRTGARRDPYRSSKALRRRASSRGNRRPLHLSPAVQELIGAITPGSTLAVGATPGAACLGNPAA